MPPEIELAVALVIKQNIEKADERDAETARYPGVHEGGVTKDEGQF
eukprot:CAMPEP_0171630344 /NCGR_PEP_ID=MMETSP0990-20121206/22845_1 /TAXON_ID=483369 /ORGANISM="non described non described, Strain CCMP2098" /LENGTH=45 /DNA_ID= /DNA_START= /DNA_END= /DNA_ORIENTATION=